MCGSGGFVRLGFAIVFAENVSREENARIENDPEARFHAEYNREFRGLEVGENNSRRDGNL